MSKPTVFVSYSHRDREWKDRLVHHLEVLEREGLLDIWEDCRIPSSTDWLAEIEGAIVQSGVAVLLISVDFLCSDFIRKKEVPEFLARRKAQGLHVLPVIVRTCAWEQVEELAPIQARPRGGRALADFRGNRIERELVEIAREILHLVGVVSQSEEHGTETTAPMHQLPSPPADFVGRGEDLLAIRGAMEAGGIPICGIQGPGGVGKTALALVLAREMAAHFPDAQIFLDLQGISERPLQTHEAIEHVVRSFHPNARLPEGATLQAAYRDVLSGKRALLLMDNASGSDQVATLLPPEGCALLVTSRQKFTLPGMVTRDLGLLPGKEARDLLVKIAPRIGDRAVEIARLCGYLPFALRVAAGSLVERPDLSVEVFEQRLGREKEKARLGGGALGLGVGLLHGELQKHFYQIAVFAGDFDAPAAGAVLDLTDDETDETLGIFVRASLLEGKNGRYKQHELARAFAASRLTEDEKVLTELRHAEFFCGVLARADDLFLKGNESVLYGLALFDRERHQILAGQAWAAKNLRTSEGAASLASRYPDGGAYVLHLRLPPRQRIAWLEAGLEGARLVKDRAAEGKHFGNLGLAYADLGETRRAIEAYEERLLITREIGDRRGEGGALGCIGLAYADLGETHQAIEYHGRYLAIAREIGDRRGEGIALGSLGLAYADLGETSRAIKAYEQRLIIARDLGDRRAEGIALGNLGIAYAHLGATRNAIEHYEQQLVITREIGDRNGEGIASWNLGLAFEKIGEAHRAVELMDVRVAYLRELGHPTAARHEARVEVIRKWIASRSAHLQPLSQKRTRAKQGNLFSSSDG